MIWNSNENILINICGKIVILNLIQKKHNLKDFKILLKNILKEIYKKTQQNNKLKKMSLMLINKRLKKHKAKLKKYKKT